MYVMAARQLKFNLHLQLTYAWFGLVILNRLSSEVLLITNQHK